MFNLDKLRAVGKMVARQAQEKAAADPAAANDIIDMSPLLKEWTPGTMSNPVQYNLNDVRVYDGLPWWCMTRHTHSGEPGWEPDGNTALWAVYHGRDAAHALPFKAEGHNPYMIGHWCTEAGKAYECIADNTVWSPSVMSANWKEGHA